MKNRKPPPFLKFLLNTDDGSPMMKVTSATCPKFNFSSRGARVWTGSSAGTWGMLFLGLWLGLSAGSAAEFTFAHLSDTHVGHPGADEALRQVLQELEQTQPRPAFVIHTGNLTEFGQPAEWARYRELVQASSLKVFSVPGSHDAKWAALGWQPFVNGLGPLHYWFDYEGCHFIGLNSSLLLRGEGHIGRSQLEWLRADLATVSPETPLFLFWHHPSEILDDADELLRVLAGHRVALVLNGHQATARAAQFGPYPASISGRTFGDTGGYDLIHVTADSVTVAHRPRGEEVLTPYLTVPLAPVVRPYVEILQPQPATLCSPRLEVAAVLRNPPPAVRAEARVGDQPWQPLFVAADGARGVLALEDVSSLAPGANRLTVRFLAEDGREWSQSTPFYLEAGSNVRARWRVRLSDSVRTTPALTAQAVYVGGEDGSLYVLNRETGQLHWRFSTGSPLLSSPTVVGETVYFGSTNGTLYALDTALGQPRWQATVAGPIFSTPTVVNDRVYFGAGDGCLYCLDAGTGQEIWRYDVGALIEAQPLVEEGRVYVGSWNNRFSCLSAAEGRLIWQQEVGRNRYYSPAAAHPVALQQRIFVPSPDQSLYIFEAATGGRIGPQDAHAYDSIGVTPDAVLVRTLDGYLYAYDAEGVVRWRTAFGWGWDNAAIAPVFAAGRIFTGSKNGTVYALTSDGQPWWQYRLTTGFMFSTVAADDSLVVAGTMDGVVTALEWEEGQGGK